ncbi:Acetyltransferase (GNAT) domain-containing protein [Tistlia consotensis]|uniref:Acetyltransferase (GNAT) family protein n=1 Tax=Tistlia consotensis USBA 355 TaxID=560819 RepID=A0A1Y6CKS5_9PROT|nr:GNAT family N-acetyltransferase [Tistlia consotensis]SMF72554.1 Acetyltransferase (GNAT) family protein [Tistlia consotensis USBA 355]SNS09362.1 Acetyltransferase (GNAT) domain-containing protein [Tistlia consotensis]
MNPASEAGIPLGGGIRLRPQRPEDAAFLCRLFAESHGAALLLVPLGEAEMRALVEHQAELHEMALDSGVPGARRWIVEREGRPVGRLVEGPRDGGRYLADVALLAEARGLGIGTRLVRWLQAGTAGRALTLKARRNGRALALYRRLGFEIVGDEGGLLVELRWRPAGAAAKGPTA